MGYWICFGEESEVERGRESCPAHTVGVATDSVTPPSLVLNMTSNFLVPRETLESVRQ